MYVPDGMFLQQMPPLMTCPARLHSSSVKKHVPDGLFLQQMLNNIIHRLQYQTAKSL